MFKDTGKESLLIWRYGLSLILRYAFLIIMSKSTCFSTVLSTVGDRCKQEPVRQRHLVAFLGTILLLKGSYTLSKVLKSRQV